MQALWMLAASAMFALMGAFVKFSTDLAASLPQIVLFRGLPSVLVLLAWALFTKQTLRPERWRAHLVRNLSGVTSMWLGFYALSWLALGTATSLTYTAPLFIACWLIGWGGGQRDAVRIFCVVLGFLGVIAVLRPSIGEHQWLAAAAGLVAGGLSAVAMMQLRSIGQSGEAAWRTVFIFSLVVSVSSLAGLFLEGWHEISLPAWGALFGIGVTGLFGQLAVTRAFGSGSPMLNAALQYSTIIFATLLGIAFWGDTPDVIAWAGIGCIIAAGLLSVWWTMYETRREAIAKAVVKTGTSAL